jgi:hypothetical protein
MSPEAKKLLKTATDAQEAAVDAAYEAGKRTGIEIGVEQERERFRKMLFPDEDAPPEVPENSQENVSGLSKAAMAAGSLTNMARLMLAKDRSKSFSVTDVIDYFARHYRLTVTADQVRPILKVLSKNDEAERLDRGVYRAGPRLQVPTSLIGAA